MIKILSLFLVLFSISLSGIEPPLEMPQDDLNKQFVEAVMGGQVAQALDLLEKGADPSASPQLLCDLLEKKVTFSQGQSKKQNEYEKNRIKLIDLLIEDSRTNLNCKSATGQTPLMYFVFSHNRYVVEKILKSGRVNINARNEHGLTALDLAKSKEMKELLLKAGAQPGVRILSGIPHQLIPAAAGQPRIPAAAQPVPTQPMAGQKRKEAEPVQMISATQVPQMPIQPPVLPETQPTIPAIQVPQMPYESESESTEEEEKPIVKSSRAAPRQ